MVGLDGRLVGWLGDRLVGLDGRLVGWLGDRLVGWFGWQVGWLVGWSSDGERCPCSVEYATPTRIVMKLRNTTRTTPKTRG